ncbi:phage antirepressor KilAC domain-containing protein [Basfia succiniciproducens]|uniref:phage antirepressor KilAC domain-containing protein n=1 Tax=Basfia succiniciproducens TaxID=653940 RepID=UPI0008B43A35|nr:phage regulatory protein/antirepressor Ant [Basfia succiniciproducens]SEQ73760.1 Phage regulatory protein Rha (Phage_pRha) [Basfia succiniciproducens]
MNNLIASTANNTLTMSSREIAELCEKQHKNVLADIDKMLNELEIHSAEFSAQYKDSTGRTLRCYNLPKDLTITLIAGYNVKLRKRIIDRWQELEQNQGKPDLMTVLNDPSFLRNALAEYSEKVIELTPKANAFDRIATKSDGSLNLTESAKHLQVPPKKFNQFLFAHGWIYRRAGGKSWVAYQDKLKSGYLEHKVHTVHQYDGTESLYPQVLITAKGLAKLAKMLEMPQQLLLE